MSDKNIKIITVFLFLSIHGIYSQFTNTAVVASIKTQSVEEGVVIRAIASNTTEIYKNLRYVFSEFTTDSLGVLTKTKKSEPFTLAANEQKLVATTSIGVETVAKKVFLLLLYEDDQIVGKSRVAFNEETQVPAKSAVITVDDGIELKGIVIEETKTKPGKDFYEFFYNLYTLHKINGNKIVGVYEKLSFGRSTIIQVKIEDTVIHEFLGKPDITYLEQTAKTAIRKVYKYFKDQKKQKNDIFQY